jgi:hypothetical protein
MLDSRGKVPMDFKDDGENEFAGGPDETGADDSSEPDASEPAGAKLFHEEGGDGAPRAIHGKRTRIKKAILRHPRMHRPMTRMHWVMRPACGEWTWDLRVLTGLNPSRDSTHRLVAGEGDGEADEPLRKGPPQKPKPGGALPSKGALIITRPAAVCDPHG